MKPDPIIRCELCGRELRAPHRSAEHHFCGRCCTKFSKNYPRMIKAVELRRKPCDQMKK